MSIFGPDNMPFAQTRFKGQREGNVDYFDEVQESELSGGSLGGSEGMRELMKPVLTPMVDGLKVSFRCTWCGHPLAPVITWSELLFISHNLNPTNPLKKPQGVPTGMPADIGTWVHVPQLGGYMPILPHNTCRQPQQISISPAEAGEALQFGLSQGLCTSRTDKNWPTSARIMNYLRQDQNAFPVG